VEDSRQPLADSRQRELDISDQQAEKAYAEIAEGTEFTEKRTQDPGKKSKLGHAQRKKKPKTQVQNRHLGHPAGVREAKLEK
jgi:hypothetical protein